MLNNKFIYEEILRICNITRKILNYTHTSKAANEKIDTNKDLLTFPKQLDRTCFSPQIDNTKK